MVVEHTVEAFERNSHIDEITIVSNPFYIAEFENMTIRNGWKKSRRFCREERNAIIPVCQPSNRMPERNAI